MTFPISWYVAGGLAVALGLQTLHVYKLKGDIDRTAIAAMAAVTAGLQLKIDTDNDTRSKNEESDRIHQAELDRLRDDLDAIPSTRLSDGPASPVIVYARKACPASPSKTDRSDDPIGVLANVLGRIEAREEVYARTADERRIAGLDCERRYDALPGGEPLKGAAP